MKPVIRETLKGQMPSEQSLLRSVSRLRTGPMEPAAGNGKDADIIYGLHAVREALRSGSRPLLRLLLVHQDRQFADVVQLAKAARVPIHVEPRAALDRLVSHGKHQGVIGVVAAKRYAEIDE